MIESVKNLNKFEKVLWMVSVILVTGSFILSGNGAWLTLAASLVGVTALIFVAKGDVLGQILTIGFSILYALISFQFRYWGGDDHISWNDSAYRAAVGGYLAEKSL